MNDTTDQDDDDDEFVVGPFLTRKYEFDGSLGDILDEAASAQSSVFVNAVRYKGVGRKQVLGKWYDNFVSLTFRWAGAAIEHDEKWGEACDEEKLQIEQEYAGFEQATIAKMLKAVTGCVTKVGAAHLQPKLNELQTAWGPGGEKQMSVLRVAR